MWSNDYVGLPFKPYGRSRSGIDCWGLYWLVMKEQAGIMLPAFDTVDFNNGKEISETMLAEREAHEWETVDRLDAYHFDCVLMRGVFAGRANQLEAAPVHVGCFVHPGRVLHIERHTDSVCVQISDIAYRIAGIYRHRAMI